MRWIRTSASLGVAALLCLALTPSRPPLAAQKPMVEVYPGDDAAEVLHVVFSDTVVSQLARAWKDYTADPSLPERAYCLSRYETFKGPDLETVIIVRSITRAWEDTAHTTPDRIVYACGLVPAIHTHPPTECLPHTTGPWSCHAIPPDNLEWCSPSGLDERTVNGNWHRFNLIQCGAYRYVVFTGSRVE